MSLNIFFYLRYFFLTTFLVRKNPNTIAHNEKKYEEKTIKLIKNSFANVHLLL